MWRAPDTPDDVASIDTPKLTEGATPHTLKAQYLKKNHLAKKYGLPETRATRVTR